MNSDKYGNIMGHPHSRESPAYYSRNDWRGKDEIRDRANEIIESGPLGEPIEELEQPTLRSGFSPRVWYCSNCLMAFGFESEYLSHWQQYHKPI